MLPLLPKYNGKLELRLKINKEIPAEHPDEIDIVSFPSGADFEAYRNDEERTKYASLFQASVEKASLIEGQLFSY